MQLDTQQAGVKASYQRISLGIGAGLARLGADVEIAERWQGERGKGWRGACLGSLAPYEVTAHGRKLMGHAQWLKGRVFLHQSSLLLKNRQAELAPFLQTPEGSGARLCHQLKGLAVGLAELLKELPSYEEISLVIKEGLEGVLGIDLEQGEVFAQEEELAQQLVNNKYGTPAWSLRL